MTYPLYTLYSLLALCVVLVLKSAYTALLSPLHHIPGPLLNAWTSIPLSLNFFRSRKFHYTHLLHRQHGPVVRTAPNEVAVCEIQAVRAIHKTSNGFVKSSMYSQFDLEGTMLCLTSPKEHAQRRKYFAGAFKVSSLRDWNDVIGRKVQDAATKIKENGRTEKGVDILGIFSSMATEIVAEICFGQMFRGGQDCPEEVMLNEIRKQLHSSSHVKVPIPSMISQNNPVDAKEPSWQDATTTFDKPRQTLLTRAIAENEYGVLSHAVIAKESKAFMVAGTDTTATTLTYLIWAVLQRPIVRSRLQVEIDSLSPDFTLHDVEQLPYLDMVMKEGLRVYGAVPSGLPRLTPKGGRELCGYFVPEGTVVTTQSWSVHRNGDIFEHPDEFVPERWENPTLDMKESFMPFGIGARACIGLNLAQTELKLSTVSFFRTCPTAELAPGMSDRDMEVMDRFVSHPRGGRCMIVIR